MIKYKTEYLETYRRGLTLSAKYHINKGIPNRLNNGKTNIAHEVLFDQSNKGLIMFAEGFRNKIFDTESVINSFKNLVKRLIESNTLSEPVIDIIIKKERTQLDADLQKSVFFKEIRKFSKRVNRTLLSINYIDPYCEITTPFNFQINPETKFGKDIVVLNNSKKMLASDVNTFQLFSEEFLRVRIDTFNPHDSQAIINCGKNNETLEKVKKTFNFIKRNENTIPYKFD